MTMDKKKDGEGKIFRCRERGEVGHYQVECLMFLRKQKNSFSVTLSGDDTDESDEEGEDNLSFEQLKIKWKEDSETRPAQKEKNTEPYGRK